MNRLYTLTVSEDINGEIVEYSETIAPIQIETAKHNIYMFLFETLESKMGMYKKEKSDAMD